MIATLWGTAWDDAKADVKVENKEGKVENMANTEIELFDDLETLIAEETLADDVEKERLALQEQSLLLDMNRASNPDLICADEVEEVPTSWLWEGYLAAELTVFTGASDSLKTHLTCKIASWFSAGQVLPDGQQAPMFPVIMVNLEDKKSELVKRIKSNGGDLTNVKFLSEVRVDDATNIRTVGKHPFSLPRDMKALSRAIEQVGAGLVIIDPVGAVCEKAKNDSFVRSEITTPLTKLCEDLDVGVILINHARRGHFNENNFLSFADNAKAFVEAARMSCLIMPEDGSEGVSVWKQVKNSNGKRREQLRYTLESNGVSNGPYVKFLEGSNALALSSNAPTALQDIKAFLWAHGMAYGFEQGVHQSGFVQALRKRHAASTVKMALVRAVEDGRLLKSERGIYCLPHSLRPPIKTLSDD